MHYLKSYAVELKRIGRNVLISSSVTFCEVKPNLHFRIKRNSMGKKQEFEESDNLFS